MFVSLTKEGSLMIVAERKPFDEIKELIQGYKKVLVVGCGTCVAVCLTGGEKEVGVLSAELKLSNKTEADPATFGEATVSKAMRCGVF